MPDIDLIYCDIEFWAARTFRSSIGKSFYYRTAVLLSNLTRWGL